MIWKHFSRVDDLHERLDWDFDYSPRSDGDFLLLPPGFYGCEGTSWKDLTEYWGDPAPYGYRLYLKETGNFVILDTEERVEEFDRTWTRCRDRHQIIAEDYPDWRQLMEVYDGIVVAPYSHDMRRKFEWYRCFDVASICIWNLRAGLEWIDAIDLGLTTSLD